MDQLVDSLMEELNCNTVFTIPLFGGIDVLESVVVTWIIMAIIMIGSLIWVHGLKIRKISGKQAALESGFSFLYNFFLDLLGEEGKDYIPYLITVVIYIAIANMIGLLGFKSPTKDLNVTASLAVMSIVLVEAAGIRKKGVKGWVKSFAEPIPYLCTGAVYPAAVAVHATVWKCAWRSSGHGTDQISAALSGATAI